LGQSSSHDQPTATAEAAEAARNRRSVADAAYYRMRAEAHGRLAEAAAPGIGPIHDELSAAYGAAATAAERGEPVDFAGRHRAERRPEPPRTVPGGAGPTLVAAE